MKRRGTQTGSDNDQNPDRRQTLMEAPTRRNPEKQL